MIENINKKIEKLKNICQDEIYKQKKRNRRGINVVRKTYLNYIEGKRQLKCNKTFIFLIINSQSLRCLTL